MAEPSQPAAGWGRGEVAELVPRALARVVDLVLVYAASLVIVAMMVSAAIAGLPIGNGLRSGGLVTNTVSALLNAALYLGYFTVMEATRGQTVGKMVLRLRTVGPTGARPTVEQAVRRNAWTALGIVGAVPVIGWLLAPLLQLVAVVLIAVSINASPVGRGWHDDFAGGTQVVRVPG